MLRAHNLGEFSKSLHMRNLGNVVVECCLHGVCWHTQRNSLVADVMVAAVLTAAILPLPVGVAAATLEVALSAEDRAPGALHGSDIILVAHIVVAAVDAVLGAIALEHLALTPSVLAFGGEHRLAKASDIGDDPMDAASVAA